jgi:TonB family protein
MPELILQPFPPHPQYSEEARQAKAEGLLYLSLIVGADGKTRDIRVTGSVGKGLDERAIDTVRKWRYRPGKYKGRAVPVRATMVFHFGHCNEYGVRWVMPADGTGYSAMGSDGTSTKRVNADQRLMMALAILHYPSNI